MYIQVGIFQKYTWDFFFLSEKTGSIAILDTFFLFNFYFIKIFKKIDWIKIIFYVDTEKLNKQKFTNYNFIYLTYTPVGSITMGM